MLKRAAVDETGRDPGRAGSVEPITKRGQYRGPGSVISPTVDHYAPGCPRFVMGSERSARKSACCVRRGGGWKRGTVEMV